MYPDRTRQLDLYKKMLSTERTESLHKDIGTVMHLSLTATCRTHCKAVVEGMGKCLTVDNEQRGSLSNEALERETFIRWQGPEPSSKNATELIDRALDERFGGRRNWHFTTQTEKF